MFRLPNHWANGGDECAVEHSHRRLTERDGETMRLGIAQKSTMICDGHLGIRAVTPDTLQRAGQWVRYSRSPRACANSRFSDYVLQTLHWARSKTATKTATPRIFWKIQHMDREWQGYDEFSACCTSSDSSGTEIHLGKSCRWHGQTSGYPSQTIHVSTSICWLMPYLRHYTAMSND